MLSYATAAATATATATAAATAAAAKWAFEACPHVGEALLHVAFAFGDHIERELGVVLKRLVDEERDGEVRQGGRRGSARELDLFEDGLVPSAQDLP